MCTVVREDAKGNWNWRNKASMSYFYHWRHFDWGAAPSGYAYDVWSVRSLVKPSIYHLDISCMNVVAEQLYSVKFFFSVLKDHVTFERSSTIYCKNGKKLWLIAWLLILLLFNIYWLHFQNFYRWYWTSNKFVHRREHSCCTELFDYIYEFENVGLYA